jgi:hypothetical protein
MNPRLILTLLTIAKEARQYPQLRHLSEEALRALESEHVSVLDHIQPIMIVDRFTDEKESATETASAARRTS